MYSAILCWQAAEAATAKPEEPVVMTVAMAGRGATVTRITELEALLAVRSEVMVSRADPVAGGAGGDGGRSADGDADGGGACCRW